MDYEHDEIAPALLVCRCYHFSQGDKGETVAELIDNAIEPFSIVRITEAPHSVPLYEPIPRSVIYLSNGNTLFSPDPFMRLVAEHAEAKRNAQGGGR